MKKFFQSLFFFAVILVAGCSKEKPPEPVPAQPVPPAKVDAAIFNPQIEALHKAQSMDQAAEDSAAAQRKQIDKLTQ